MYCCTVRLAESLTGVLPAAGTKSIADPLRVSPVSVGMDLLHTLLAVSHAPEEGQLLAQVSPTHFSSSSFINRALQSGLVCCKGAAERGHRYKHAPHPDPVV